MKCLMCVKAYLRHDKNMLTVMSNNDFNIDLHNLSHGRNLNNNNKNPRGQTLGVQGLVWLRGEVRRLEEPSPKP